MFTYLFKTKKIKRRYCSFCAFPILRTECFSASLILKIIFYIYRV